MEGPLAEPWKAKARPSSTWPLSYREAPTMTSEYPSPFTSPAVAADQPNAEPPWFDSAVHAIVAASPAADPW